MASTFKAIVRKYRRITLPEEFKPGQAVEVTVKPLVPAKESQKKTEVKTE